MIEEMNITEKDCPWASRPCKDRNCLGRSTEEKEDKEKVFVLYTCEPLNRVVKIIEKDKVV
jgi:hypothetical protein